MKTLSCIVTCMHVCLALNTGMNKHGLRIRGGRNATEDEFPYVVKLVLQSLTTRLPGNKFMCSGIALSSKWTLTAGHCVTIIEQALYQLRNAGMAQTKTVVEYQPSPKAEVAYSEITSMSLPTNSGQQSSIRNDVGLLHTQPVLLPKYGKLSSIDYAALIGQEVSIVGYGMIMNPKEEPPLVPQVIGVIVRECSFPYHYPQMCFAPSCGAVGAGSQAICPGDSGGPGVHASGVVSVNTATDGRDCGLRLDPAWRRSRYDVGYKVGSGTPVSPFIDWISSVMNTEIAL